MRLMERMKPRFSVYKQDALLSVPRSDFMELLTYKLLDMILFLHFNWIFFEKLRDV